MKTITLILAGLLTTPIAFAQNCDQSYFASKGATFELTEHDKTGAIKSVQILTVSSVNKSGNQVESTYQSIKKDDKGSQTEDRILHYNCSTSGIELQLGAQDKNTKKEAIIFYPSPIKPGDSLKDNPEIEYKTVTPEGQKASIGFSIKNRKFLGYEQQKSPAGTWNCMKISYSAKFTLKVGVFKLPIEGNAIEWYSPEVGIVRSEFYVKDQLESYTELTKAHK